MTKIFDNGDLWIEFVQGATLTVGAAGTYTSNVNLSKPGRFVGGGGFVAASTVHLNFGGIRILQTNGLQILYGNSIGAVRLQCLNVGGAQDLTLNAIIILKK